MKARPLGVAALLAIACSLPVFAIFPEWRDGAPDLNDSTFHLGVARAAAQAMQAGANPIDFWLPNWLAGYPLFHYYQFLPPLTVAGLHSMLPEGTSLLAVQRAVLLVVLALFPAANFVALRQLRLPLEACVAAAFLSFAVSAGGRYGIEWESFTWYGWGLFSQAFALPLLPVSMAAGWRVVEGRRTSSLLAAAWITATTLAHVLYGYVALVSILLASLCAASPRDLLLRCMRAALLAAQVGALLAFFLVPLLSTRAYHAVSLYDPASKFDSHGARQILSWWISGDFLDHGRLPALTLLCVMGLYLCLRHAWLERDRVHAWVGGGFLVWLALYCGRPTWGGWIDLLPLGRGLHLERLTSAVHVFALWAAAIAVGALVQRMRHASTTDPRRFGALLLVVAALTVVAEERGRYLQRNAASVAATTRRHAVEAPAFAPILAYLEAHPGRVYAGRRGDWGQQYLVAGIPVYHLLSAAGVATIGHAPFSWPWSTDFQLQIGPLDERVSRLYDIAYLLAPEGITPPNAAELVVSSGAHRLYRLRHDGPFSLVHVPLAVRGDFGTTWAMTQSWDQGLWSRRAAHARIALPDDPATGLPEVNMPDAYHFTRPGESERRSVFDPPGIFMSEPPAAPIGRFSDVETTPGRAETIVEIDEAAVVLFRSTFHPGWQAFVDDHPTPTMLLTPGFVGVEVPVGKHRLRLVYASTWNRGLLFILGVVAAWLLARVQARVPHGVPIEREGRCDPVARETNGMLPPVPRGFWLGTAAVALIALLVHLALAPMRGWDRDLYWFATWTRAAVEHGAARVATHVWCDYPPGYLYVLEAVGRAWQALSDMAWPADGSPASHLMLKLPTMVGTLVTVFALARGALRYLELPGALLLAASYALNPAVLVNGPVWGQVDALLALLLLLCCYELWRGRIVLGFAWFAAALAFKTQAIAVLPMLLAYVHATRGAAGVLDALRGGLIGGILLLVPLYHAGTVSSLVDSQLNITERYPLVSMNANNLWWLVFGPASLWTSDLLHFGSSTMTYRSLGLALWLAATLAIVWRLRRQLRQGSADGLVILAEACCLQFLAFYLFPTQMHERYVVPALLFLALAGAANRAALWGYVVASVAIAVSLASALAANYPQPLGPLEWLLRADRGETYVVAAALVALFVGMFLRGLDRRGRWYAAAYGLVVSVGLAVAVYRPVPDAVRLADRSPVRVEQAWGTVQRGRSVEGSRLSVAGFVFRDGIGTHANSRLTYHLGGAFDRFETAFGVDDEGNRGQRVRFRLWADDALRFDSGNLTAGGFPRRVEVSVAGAQFLTLEALDGGDGRDHDHIDWLAPTLYR